MSHALQSFGNFCAYCGIAAFSVMALISVATLIWAGLFS